MCDQCQDNGCTQCQPSVSAGSSQLQIYGLRDAPQPAPVVPIAQARARRYHHMRRHHTRKAIPLWVGIGLVILGVLG
jgi:aminoglycoside phosphotransferase (APT) family kinase protein